MRIRQQVVFLGYSDSVSDDDKVFDPGDVLVATKVGKEGDISCVAMTVDGQLDRTRAEMVWVEEVLVLNNVPLVVF